MNAHDLLGKLAQLKRDYEQDCAALRLGLYGKPWLLNPRLAERGDKFDEATIAVLSQQSDNDTEAAG